MGSQSIIALKEEKDLNRFVTGGRTTVWLNTIQQGLDDFEWIAFLAGTMQWNGERARPEWASANDDDVARHSNIESSTGTRDSTLESRATLWWGSEFPRTALPTVVLWSGSSAGCILFHPVPMPVAGGRAARASKGAARSWGTSVGKVAMVRVQSGTRLDRQGCADELLVVAGVNGLVREGWM